jgi:hypothetical protein
MQYIIIIAKLKGLIHPQWIADIPQLSWRLPDISALHASLASNDFHLYSPP